MSHKPPKITCDVLVFQLSLIFHLWNYLIISLSFFIMSCWALFLNTGRSDILLWTWAILTGMYVMLPTDYAYVCVNRVSIDPVTQCCTSAKLCCRFMNILYHSGFCNVVQKHWFSKRNPAVYTGGKYWKNTARQRPPESL